MIKKYFMLPCILLSTLLSQSLWALDCSIPPQLNIYQTDNIYPNSVLWLKSVTGEPIQPITLNPKRAQNSLIPSQLGSDHSFQKLQPQHHLSPDQHYTANLKKQFGDAIFQNELSIQVQPYPPAMPLTWVKQPTLTDVHYDDNTGYGAIGRLSMQLKTSWKPEDYLVLIHITNPAQSSTAQSLITRPYTAANQLHEIAMGFDLCSSGVDDFTFQPGERISVTFDLISHDGNIIPWQTEPLIFTLATDQIVNASPAIPAEQTVSLWQKIKSWFFNLVSSIFQEVKL